jgi:hypothetical protein
VLSASISDYAGGISGENRKRAILFAAHYGAGRNYASLWKYRAGQDECIGSDKHIVSDYYRLVILLLIYDANARIFVSMIHTPDLNAWCGRDIVADRDSASSLDEVVEADIHIIADDQVLK